MQQDCIRFVKPQLKHQPFIKIQHGIAFSGCNCGSRDFYGVLLEALEIYLGVDFCPQLHIPVTLYPVFPPGIEPCIKLQ